MLIITRYWSARYAWVAHERAAARPGSRRRNHRGDPAISGSRTSRSDDERLVYEAVTELLERRSLSQPTYDRMLKAFGLDATIEIFSIAGLYSMVSTVLNGFDVPPRTAAKQPF